MEASEKYRRSPASHSWWVSVEEDGASDATRTASVFLAGDWVGPVGLLADASLASGEAAGRAASGAIVGR